jgi:hypothetical protein
MTRHPADLLSLAFGLLFAAIGLVLIVGDIDARAMEWILPAAAIAFGAVLIWVARSRRPAVDQ